MVYIDLNMVRAGVVNHPKDWPFGGYRHIVAPPRRYQLTANKRLMELMNISEIDRFCETYRNWVDAAIMRGDINRQPQWTEGIAVGDKVYVEKVKDQMGYKAIGRKVVEDRDSFVLKETQQSYQSISNKAKGVKQADNAIHWQNEKEANLDSNMGLEGSF